MIAAAVHLAYGLSRLLSMALDGLPTPLPKSFTK